MWTVIGSLALPSLSCVRIKMVTSKGVITRSPANRMEQSFSSLIVTCTKAESFLFGRD